MIFVGYKVVSDQWLVLSERNKFCEAKFEFKRLRARWEMNNRIMIGHPWQIYVFVRDALRFREKNAKCKEYIAKLY